LPKAIERLPKSDRKFQKQYDKMVADSRREMKELNKQLGGISNSNGEMAEEYFYSAFKTDKTFANEKFDRIKRNQAYRNDEREAEFDIVLLNGKSAALIEVKYNAKPNNIDSTQIISRVEIFKMLYPKCKDFNIFLGVAAMSFKKGLEEELHQAGIATIRQIGKKMVVFDKTIKAF
jgi:hypothetical protein